MHRRASPSRRHLAVGALALLLASGSLAVGTTSAVAQTPTLDELELGEAALYLTGTHLAAYEMPPGVPSELIVDAVRDTAGVPPETLPAGLLDIQGGAMFIIPAGNTGGLQRTCSNPPPGVVVSCDDRRSIAGDMALAVFQLGASLPDPWRPMGPQSVYVGDVIDTTPDSSDGLGGPFHGAGTGVASGGYGDFGWSPFFEGLSDPAQAPFLALFPSTGIAAVAMPVTALQHGFRPFVSFAGPPQTVGQGVFDLLGEPGVPPTLLGLSQPVLFREDLFVSPGLTPDPAQVPSVLRYDDPPGDLWVSGAVSIAGASDPVVDIRWSDGAVVAPALDPGELLAAYPCGEANAAGAFTLCSPGVDAAAGPFVMVQGGFDAVVPLDGDRMLDFGVAFDSDDRPSTDRQPSTDVPDDPYQGTDRRYQATYLPDQMTWTLDITDETLKDARPGNATATSGARAIIDGPSITWLIPLSEFQAQLPRWRVISTTADDTSAQATTAIDVSSGGPGSTWSLQALSDPGALVVIVPPKPAVVGGCVTSAPYENPAVPVLLVWTIDVIGLGDIPAPTADVKVGWGAGGSSESKGIPASNGVISFSQPVAPGTTTLASLVIQGGSKPIDLTKSWREVFGKSFKVTAKGGQEAGPDCP